jgi:hypothetical protein
MLDVALKDEEIPGLDDANAYCTWQGHAVDNVLATLTEKWRAKAISVSVSGFSGA